MNNETIIKAGKAAGLDFIEKYGLLYFDRVVFNPSRNDTDNAMIMDGAEVNVSYGIDFVRATSPIAFVAPFDIIGVMRDVTENKAQARREAVILCAAAKWDAMNGQVK